METSYIIQLLNLIEQRAKERSSDYAWGMLDGFLRSLRNTELSEQLEKEAKRLFTAMTNLNEV